MIYIIALFLNFQFQNTIAGEPENASACADQCEFYQKFLEKSVPCGPKGYALEYGEKYCKRFKESESQLSPQGKVWTQNTRRCLIDSLKPFATLAEPSSCQIIHNLAFESHSRCYTNDNCSICDLPASDIEKIVEQMDIKDMTSQDGQKQIKSVVNTCVARLEKKLETPIDQADVQLHNQLSTWKSFAEKISYMEWFYGQSK